MPFSKCREVLDRVSEIVDGEDGTVTRARFNAHLAMCHDIYDRPYPCDFPGCTFVGKLKNHLTQHIRKSHTPRPARRPVGRPRAPRPVAPPAPVAVGPQAAVVDV